MTVRRLFATGLASAALLGGALSGAGGALASTSHGSHCVPGPTKTCSPKPKPPHVPKTKRPTTGTPHQSHHKTPPPGH
jgi:hypothetical protein